MGAARVHSGVVNLASINDYSNICTFRGLTEIGCCQSTIKACRSVFQYMRFFMSCEKFEAPEVRYTLVFMILLYRKWCEAWLRLYRMGLLLKCSSSFLVA